VPIPDYQSMMLPMLETLADGREQTSRDLAASLALRFGLSDEERRELLPSGHNFVFGNRIAWCKTYLRNAGLLDYPARGIVRISDLGREVLRSKPAIIDNKFLHQYPTYREFVRKKAASPVDPTPPTPKLTPFEPRTPHELIEEAYRSHAAATAEDLLTRFKNCPPQFFEKVVVQLLMAMGYGGVDGRGMVTGKSGDGGIDGVIEQDKLGLDIVCIQAKRWDGAVGRPVIQGFVGSMDYVRAKKGVIMTTSNFTKDAIHYVDRIEGKKVVLIDGARLAGLMIEHDLGVTLKQVYRLKDVSNDFFEEAD